jgi:hypothetical protein
VEEDPVIAPWIQRLATIVVGVGVCVTGALVPGLTALVPLGTLIIGTVIPHPADREKP